MRHRRQGRPGAGHRSGRSAACATRSSTAGPDDWGVFVEGGAGLGMRRLSIIDLAGGHQPIANEDGSVVVVMNGEIYNYPELRPRAGGRGATASAPAATPRSWSISTRSTARGCSRGCAACSRFAIWDRHRPPAAARRATTSGRSRCSTPIADGRLTFASEIKALLADDPSLAELSPLALDQYLTLRFVQPPETFFPRVRALPPAHYMVWEDGAAADRALLAARATAPSGPTREAETARADRRAAGGDGVGCTS